MGATVYVPIQDLATEPGEVLARLGTHAFPVVLAQGGRQRARLRVSSVPELANLGQFLDQSGVSSRVRGSDATAHTGMGAHLLEVRVERAQTEQVCTIESQEPAVRGSPGGDSDEGSQHALFFAEELGLPNCGLKVPVRVSELYLAAQYEVHGGGRLTARCMVLRVSRGGTSHAHQHVGCKQSLTHRAERSRQQRVLTERGEESQPA